nr:unnamed protein product [Callosobruchus analis]
MPPKQRKKWDAESMRKAVEAIKNKETGTLKARNSFNAPEDPAVSKWIYCVKSISVGVTKTVHL